MKQLLTIALLCLGLQALGQHTPTTRKVRAEILESLNKQDAAWNRGDLEGFMQTYWQHDSLQFVGKEGITYGWQATLARYRRVYGSNPAGMGTLTTTNLHIYELGPDAAYVVGRWQLAWADAKANAPKQGHYLLVLRKMNGRWLVVADHSS